MAIIKQILAPKVPKKHQCGHIRTRPVPRSRAGLEAFVFGSFRCRRAAQDVLWLPVSSVYHKSVEACSSDVFGNVGETRSKIMFGVVLAACFLLL